MRSRVPCPSSLRSPLEEVPYVSELDDKIGELLEAAGISQEYCDRISALVQEAEADAHNRRESSRGLIIG